MKIQDPGPHGPGFFYARMLTLKDGHGCEKRDAGEPCSRRGFNFRGRRICGKAREKSVVGDRIRNQIAPTVRQALKDLRTACEHADGMACP